MKKMQIPHSFSHLFEHFNPSERHKFGVSEEKEKHDVLRSLHDNHQITIVNRCVIRR